MTPRLACGLLLGLFVQSALFAWGPAGHKWVHARALEHLPPALAAILGPHRDYLVEHSIDPDSWRETDPEEAPRHYIDLDNYGNFPFPRFTLDYEQLVRREGQDKVKANGLVLWTISQVMDRLTRAFRSGDQQAMLREAVALGHYVDDLHQPFHAVANFDGQFTGQKGIHARFEVDATDRILATLEAGPGKLYRIDDPLRQAFDIAMDSLSMVNLILIPEWQIVRDLKIDRETLPRDPEKKIAVYPESYFQRLTERTGPVAAKRLQEAVWSVASFWTQAWENSR